MRLLFPALLLALLATTRAAEGELQPAKPSPGASGMSKSCSWADGGARQSGQRGEGEDGGHGQAGCTLQDGGKQEGSTWVSMVPWQIPAHATAGLPAQSWDHGTAQSVPSIPAGPGWQQGKELL